MKLASERMSGGRHEVASVERDGGLEGAHLILVARSSTGARHVDDEEADPLERSACADSNAVAIQRRSRFSGDSGTDIAPLS